jgi:hypothetical protein
MVMGRTLLPLVGVVNYLLFCGDQLLPSLRFLKHRSSGNVVNFKRAARQARRRRERVPYTRKCAVCGRTDAEHPELEFRYCSKCEGYHCFCQDHINSHVHFKE